MHAEPFQQSHEPFTKFNSFIEFILKFSFTFANTRAYENHWQNLWLSWNGIQRGDVNLVEPANVPGDSQVAVAEQCGVTHL